MMLIFNGETYSSLSEAATRLGLSQPHLSGLKRKHQLSDEEVLQHALERRDQTGRCGNKKPCSVFGTYYASAKEACNAHGIPYISLYSRLSRHGETIEEAIAALLSSKKNKLTEEFVFSKSKLRELQVSTEPEKDSTKGLIKKLSARAYSPAYFEEVDSDAFIIRIRKTLSIEREGQCWIFIGKKYTKLVVTDFCPPVEHANRYNVLDMLNTKNAQNAGIALWLREEVGISNLDITAGTVIPNKEVNEPPVMTVLHDIERIFAFCQSVGKELNW